MPVIKNAKHELFADMVANGRHPTDAYAVVYNKKPTPACRVTAAKLKTKLSLRILEISNKNGIAPADPIITAVAKKASPELIKEVEGVIEEASKQIKKVAVRAMETIGAFLTVAERRAFLADLVRTPIGEVDQNSALCQEYTRRVIMGKETEADAEIIKIKMPDKLTALKLDAQMAGELSLNETTVNVGNVQSITVVLPSVVATPRIPNRVIDIEGKTL